MGHYEELIIKYDKRVMKLENIINKAIEYIEQCVDFVSVDVEEIGRLEYILEILEGGKDT